MINIWFIWLYRSFFSITNLLIFIWNLSFIHPHLVLIVYFLLYLHCLVWQIQFIKYYLLILHIYLQNLQKQYLIVPFQLLFSYLDLKYSLSISFVLSVYLNLDIFLDFSMYLTSIDKFIIYFYFIKIPFDILSDYFSFSIDEFYLVIQKLPHLKSINQNLELFSASL